MSRVLVNHLRVRVGPSKSRAEVAYYDAGQVINSGDGLIRNDGSLWLSFTDRSGNKIYVCATNNDGSKYVDYPPDLPIISISIPGVPPPNPYQTLVPSSIACCPGIPNQYDFSDNRLKHWGCIFLCTCRRINNKSSM